MNVNGITALVTLDVFNTYSDILDERIRVARQEGSRRIFIGDCMVYTTQLLINFGWTPDADSPDTLFDIVKTVLSMSFMRNDEYGMAEWSDDLNYVVLY